MQNQIFILLALNNLNFWNMKIDILHLTDLNIKY